MTLAVSVDTAVAVGVLLAGTCGLVSGYLAGRCEWGLPSWRRLAGRVCAPWWRSP